MIFWLTPERPFRVYPVCFILIFHHVCISAGLNAVFKVFTCVRKFLVFRVRLRTCLYGHSNDFIHLCMYMHACIFFLRIAETTSFKHLLLKIHYVDLGSSKGYKWDTILISMCITNFIYFFSILSISIFFYFISLKGAF